MDLDPKLNLIKYITILNICLKKEYDKSSIKNRCSSCVLGSKAIPCCSLHKEPKNYIERCMYTSIVFEYFIRDLMCKQNECEI